MPETKRPLKVFLCHAHSDKKAVRDLYLRLIRDDVDAWLDKEKLLPGQDWEYEIRKAVREADVVVVCLSKQFNQAGFRQKEVRLALDTAMEQPEGEIFIIPARLEECDNLESLRKWHWVDLFEDEGYKALVKSLKLRHDQKLVIEKAEREKKERESIAAQVLSKVHAHMRKFDDASSRAAGVLPDRLLTNINELQQIRHDANSEEVQSSFMDLKTYQIHHMDWVIAILFSRLYGIDQEVTDNKLKEARQIHDQYDLELARLLRVTIDQGSDTSSPQNSSP